MDNNLCKNKNMRYIMTKGISRNIFKEKRKFADTFYGKQKFNSQCNKRIKVPSTSEL